MVRNLTRRFRARRLHRLAGGQSPRAKRHAKATSGSERVLRRNASLHHILQELYAGARQTSKKNIELHARKHFFLLTMQEPRAGASLFLQPFRELHAGTHLLLLFLEELVAGTIPAVTELHASSRQERDSGCRLPPS